MLLLNVYIDVNPRREEIAPQLVRPTLLEAGADGKHSKKSEWKNITPDTEIWRDKAQEELQGPSADDALPNVRASEEETNLAFQLKSDILKYLHDDIYTSVDESPAMPKSKKKQQPVQNVQKIVEFDKYILNIVTLAKKMAFFGFYCSRTFTDLRGAGVFQKETVNFSFREKRDKFLARSELAQLIYVLFPILFMEGSEIKKIDIEDEEDDRSRHTPDQSLDLVERQITFFGDLGERMENASKQITKMISFVPTVGTRARKKTQTGHP